MTAAQAAAAPVATSRRLRARHLWIVAGLAVALYGGSIATQYELGLAPLLIFGIVPHLTVLIGVGQPRAKGQLAPRAVPLFNATHHLVPPLLVAGVAALGFVSPFWLAGSLAWVGHIAIDRGLGNGLRRPDGWLR